jgi:ATP-dependent Clp protease adaptor protein ClpS
LRHTALDRISLPPYFPRHGGHDQTNSHSRYRPERPAGDGTRAGFLVVCWDDPVNLMQYVTHVFQVVFGWKKAKAETHMLQVHNQGKSILTRESLEKAEFYVHELQKYNLHATMERDEA